MRFPTYTRRSLIATELFSKKKKKKKKPKKFFVKEKKVYGLHIHVIGLKIPTGGRQTSWPFTSMTEELNYNELQFSGQSETYASGFQVRCALTTRPR